MQIAQEKQKATVKILSSREELEAAYHLVYREYLRKGYCSPNTSEMRFSIYNALPETVTFGLWRENDLLGTVTVVTDCGIGLPMESVYPEEIKKLRGEQRRLCEITQLTLNSELVGKGIFSIYFAERLKHLFMLFKPVFWYVQETARLTDFCIAVNPQHRALYKSLYFEEFGPERVYGSVKGHPSVAMRLQLPGLKEKSAGTIGLQRLFYGTPIAIKPVSHYFKWTAENFRYFFIEKSDVIKTATPRQLAYLKEQYPDFNL